MGSHDQSAAIEAECAMLRAALDYESAPPVCGKCADPDDPCRRHGDCCCEMDPSCHGVRMAVLAERRRLALEPGSGEKLLDAIHADLDDQMIDGEYGPSKTYLALRALVGYRHGNTDYR